ncbi:MAG TPA: hypothetical protein VFX53_09370 [Pedococcus sp.]|nr:hypothetical protein [Pedococcus sp.]
MNAEFRKRARARVGLQAACVFGCGEILTQFWSDDSIAGLTQVSATNVPITTDLTDPDIRYRLWEYRGANLGWVQLWPGADGPVRSWRPLRIEHDCPLTPANHKPPRRHPDETTASTPAPPAPPSTP